MLSLYKQLTQLSITLFQKMCRYLSLVDSGLRAAFYRLGLLIGRHPVWFVIVPILLCGLSITGFQVKETRHVKEKKKESFPGASKLQFEWEEENKFQGRIRKSSYAFV